MFDILLHGLFDCTCVLTRCFFAPSTVLMRISLLRTLARRSSPSDSGSSADEGTRSRRAGRDDRSGSPDSSIRGSEELGNGAKADHNKGTSEHLLFEVRLPTVASQGQREGHPLTVTGGAEIVADLLGCVALKCWLQSALLMHQ